MEYVFSSKEELGGQTRFSVIEPRYGELTITNGDQELQIPAETGPYGIYPGLVLNRSYQNGVLLMAVKEGELYTPDEQQIPPNATIIAVIESCFSFDEVGGDSRVGYRSKRTEAWC